MFLDLSYCLRYFNGFTEMLLAPEEIQEVRRPRLVCRLRPQASTIWGQGVVQEQVM